MSRAGRRGDALEGRSPETGRDRHPAATSSGTPASQVPGSEVPESEVPGSGVPESEVPESEVPESDVLEPDGSLRSRDGGDFAAQVSRPRRRDLPVGARVGVIGVGRVGAVLGAALGRAGFRVVAGHGVSTASRSRAAELLPGLSWRSPRDVVAASDVVLLTVPDDALADLVACLASESAFRPDHVVVHTSGRHGIGVLAPAARAGAATLAVHPAMTFTGTAADLPRLSGTRFGVTAPAGQTVLAMTLVDALGGVAVRVAESDRTLYHAALAHGANHLVTLVADAMALLRLAGNDDPAATLGPLLHAALDNALRLGDGALTGPVARGDSGTVTAHVAEISRAAPDSAELYLALARHTAARAVADSRLRPGEATALLDALVAVERPRAPGARHPDGAAMNAVPDAVGGRRADAGLGRPAGSAQAGGQSASAMEPEQEPRLSGERRFSDPATTDDAGDADRAGPAQPHPQPKARRRRGVAGGDGRRARGRTVT